VAVDLRSFVSWIHQEYEPSVRVEERAGAYASTPGGPVALYGVADMACVLHTIRRLRVTPTQRAEWAAVFDEFQDPLTGHYVERGRASHVELHVTAYTLAAMELLDLESTRPLRFADTLRTPRAATAFVETLDWASWVYLESHQGAGLGAIFALAPSLRMPSWFDAYFAALDERVDPANGMHGVDKPPEGDLDQIGGTFHYAFLYEYANRRLAHAEARIDAVLGLQRDDGLWDPENPWWLTLDGVYLLTRGVRHTGHRRADVESAVRRSVAAVAEVALDPDERVAVFGEPMGTHALVAVVSLLAEAQQFLGVDEVATDQPLRLVLDRRPFV
jgi:hypothetical protein